jgi:hypothetical protein
MKFSAAVVLALATTASAFAPPAFAPRNWNDFQSTEAASETETEER